MLDYEMKALLERFEAGDLHEDNHFEFKSSETDCAKLYDTLSSFSNQDNGGMIICGIDEKKHKICGVPNVDLVIKKIQEQCASMTPIVIPTITAYKYQGAQVIFIEIIGVSVDKRPCYKTAAGIDRGSFVRIGEGDMHMPAYDIHDYISYRKHVYAEDSELDVAASELLTPAFYVYLQALKNSQSKLAQLNNLDILRSAGLSKHGKATLAGALLFLDFPKQYYPGAVVACARYAGDSKISSLDRPIINSRTLYGNIQELYEQSITWILNTASYRVNIDPASGRHYSVSEYPETAIRELVLNALLHRDYSDYFRTEAIRIDMYSNRIEIISPGGIFGHATINDITDGFNCNTRNPQLMQAANDAGLCEDRHTGFIRSNISLQEYNLPPLKLEVRNGYFIATIYNGQDTGTSKTQVF